MRPWRCCISCPPKRFHSTQRQARGRQSEGRQPQLSHLAPKSLEWTILEPVDRFGIGGESNGPEKAKSFATNTH